VTTLLAAINPGVMGTALREHAVAVCWFKN